VSTTGHAPAPQIHEPPNCIGSQHKFWSRPDDYKHDKDAMQEGMFVYVKNPFEAVASPSQGGARSIPKMAKGVVVKVNEDGGLKICFDNDLGEVDVVKEALSNLRPSPLGPDPEVLRQAEARAGLLSAMASLATAGVPRLASAIKKAWGADIANSDATLRQAVALYKEQFKGQPQAPMRAIVELQRQFSREVQERQKQEQSGGATSPSTVKSLKKQTSSPI
jgi:hypothetical protein